MNLENLKSEWSAMNDRMEKRELFEEKMYCQMLHSKSDKSLNKMLNMEVINIVTCLLVIPFWVWLFNFHHLDYFLSTKVLSVVAIVISVFGISLSFYSLRNYFMKIDFSNKISDNVHYLNKYNILYGKGKIINYFIIFPVFTILGIWCYYELKAPAHLWVFLFVALTIGIASAYWIYKKVYEKNIQSIQKKLEELRELEEE
jgi:hypothetical protein